MSNEILDQIKNMEMLITANTAAPMTDPPVPGTDPPEELKTEPPSTEEPKDFETEEPETEEPKTEPPVTESPDELGFLKGELESLREELRKMKEGTPKTSPPATEPPLAEENFVEDIDLEEVLSSPTELNKLLNKVYKKGFEAKGDSKDVISKLSPTIKNEIETMLALRDLSDRFYRENKDLVDHKKTVAEIFDAEIKKNANRTYEEIMGVTANIAREKLKITKPSPTKPRGPRLPGKKPTQRQTPKPLTNTITSEMDEMEKALNE